MSTGIRFFCPLWGSESLPFESFLSKVKKAGYDGVEMSFPLDPVERDQLVKAVAEHELLLIAQHWETVDSNFDKHLQEYQARLQNLAATNPLFINSQTGKDYFTVRQNSALIEVAKEVAGTAGIEVIHETHRGKFGFAAHIMQQYLEQFPDLGICLDISHWCCVAETLLHDQDRAVESAIKHTRHIHSRVGFAEGPQVMDPRAPEWKEVLNTHIRWWQLVIDQNVSVNKGITITTEFGPYPYLQHLPYTNLPIYDQWEVNVFMMNLLKRTLKEQP